ncbi:MAG: hypothetical protein ACLPXT_07015 [Terracidiphilus sp.]
MRKWGIIVTLFYALIVVGLLFPVTALLAADEGPFLQEFQKSIIWVYGFVGSWILFAVVLSGQAVLLFLSVDTSFKRRKPRAHIAVSCIAASMLFALLTFAAVISLDSAIKNSTFVNQYLSSAPQVLCFCALLWLFWGILFYLYLRNSTDITTRLVSWLLKGSVLELLIAIPSHVIARRRNDCTAPAVTSFGIVTGIAVMLLCFGPSVLLLYKKRMDAYAARNSK